MKPICIITQSVYESDPRVRRKAEALVGAGYTVDVLALRAGSPEATQTFTLNGVNVRTVGVSKKRGSLSRYAFEYAGFLLWAMFRVTLQMRQRRYGAVDVNTLPDFLIFAPMFARLMGAKLILDMHEITPEFYMSKYGIAEGSLAVRVLELIERISFGFADHVVTINEPIQDLLVSRGLDRSKSIVVMNAVDEARFKPDGAAAPSSTFAMMYHGTLTRIYGLDIAVEAFGMAHHEMPGAELWILGSGPEQAILADLVARNGIVSKVKLVGHVPPSEIPSWLGRCSLGLLPIRRDVFLDFAFPNKLPEFIVAGKPVLVSRLKAIRHYFSDEALAFATPNDPADLARQMIRVYADPAWRARLASKAAIEYQPIRWELMKQRYLDLVAKSLGSTESRSVEAPVAAS